MCSTSSESTSSSSDVPRCGVLGQQRADGVGDLPPSPVADGQVDRRPRPVAGVLLGLLEDGDRLRRQHLVRAHRAHLPPAPGAGQVDGDVLDDLQQRAELGLRPPQVVGREHEEGDDADAGVVAPAEQVGDLVGAAPVAVGDVLQPDGPGPAPVPVHDHADVVRQVRALQRAGQPPLVDLGERLAHLLAGPHAATLGPRATTGREPPGGRSARSRSRPAEVTPASG